jgi:uncharacterized membrane-anchored protein YhcB (DUF1043 family)
MMMLAYVVGIAVGMAITRAVVNRRRRQRENMAMKIYLQKRGL